MKTFNGWISDVTNLQNASKDAAGNILDENGDRFASLGEEVRIKTILEGAEEKGMWTGLVSTARITHATPAAFSAHTSDRNEEDIIALQQIDHGIEVLLGGGRRNYIPQSEEGSRRTDDVDVIGVAREKGYTYVETAAEMMGVNSVPLLGLFNSSHISYAVDRVGMPGGPAGARPTEEPSLAAMTSKAIELLSQSPDGFFLMVESGRIDHCGHTNDAACAAAEVIEYDDAVGVALQFAARDGQTLIVGTSDHDTGGLSVGCCDEYTMDASGILNIRMSANQISEEIDAGASVREALVRAGVDPALISEEVESDAGAISTSKMLEIGAHAGESVVGDYRPLARDISEFLYVGWTSFGHTGGDVNVYSYGPGSDRFTGVLDNSDVGKQLISLMDVSAGINVRT